MPVTFFCATDVNCQTKLFDPKIPFVDVWLRNSLLPPTGFQHAAALVLFSAIEIQRGRGNISYIIVSCFKQISFPRIIFSSGVWDYKCRLPLASD
jgi:hypothetical protein